MNPTPGIGRAPLRWAPRTGAGSVRAAAERGARRSTRCEMRGSWIVAVQILAGLGVLVSAAMMVFSWIGWAVSGGQNRAVLRMSLWSLLACVILIVVAFATASSSGG